MGKKIPDVDHYIARSAEFAKPILSHLRKLVHQACPDVEETIKWGFPNFTHNGMLCSMASFKSHCSFGFRKGSLAVGREPQTTEPGMGHFGKITSISDLPKDKALIGYIRKAVRPNEAGIKSPTRAKGKKELTIPDYLVAALRKNKRAFAVFGKFSYSHKKEYVEWITGAKSEETRKKRFTTAVEWMSKGKGRNWKYVK